MKLPREFCRLPLRFDAERLRTEALALPAEAWKRHPLSYPGNRAVRLISGMGGENDDLGGEMRPTEHLRKCPYITQVLASFGVCWSRSRLMLIGAGGQVPQHCDVNYHWYHRVRLHIPVVTYPPVLFHCGAATVHMQAGEAWIFDNWRPHKVVNPTPHERIHLVADTVGNAAFWEMASGGQWDRYQERPAHGPAPLAFDARREARILTERHNVPVVMPPGEVELLVLDLVRDLATAEDDSDSRSARRQFAALLEGLVREWRHLWSLQGEDPGGWPSYIALRDHVRQRLQSIPIEVSMRSNQLSAYLVADGRVLRHLINLPGAEAFRKPETDRQPAT